MQRRIAYQISQAHKRSITRQLIYLNLCLIRTFLQFLRILHSCVVLLHCFFLELVCATNQGKVVVQRVMVEDLVIAAFIVGVSVDSSYEACCSTAYFGCLVRLGLGLSLHLRYQTGVWNGTIFANR